ncbi:MAG: carbamoyltransferase HypF [Gemmatimonadales bacterium]|nr:carbamoyltransferase HypF [Gemmatimonadales bacterium]
MKDERRRFVVNGIVQGVGFRPFVFNLAGSESLTGFVTNTSDGVVIEIEGPLDRLDRFARRLKDETPPLAKIVSVMTESVPSTPDSSRFFEILASENSPGTNTMIPPDVAVCSDCLREIRDANDRRFGYPFANCTNCGPRWTIIGRIPYDRPYTSMASFTMCPACRDEYDDPANRRFHAQPNACPECGPRVWLSAGDGREIAEPVAAAATLLAEGRILAVKGLGGFHLAVRADDETAVLRLRERKNREAKPLAVMVGRNLPLHVDPAEQELLVSSSSPIVLVDRKSLGPSGSIAGSVAPEHNRLGLLSPYTPLHHLLLDELAGHGINALVMTSGNAGDEPICLGNDEALERLAGIADYWLLHDRDILRRADDSVTQILGNKLHFFRRSRGYAPVPISVPQIPPGPPVLAVGAELKNTVCLLKNNQAFLSPHIGDLENLKTYEFFTETVATLQQVLECEPKVVAHDLHPGYFSTRWAKEWAEEQADKPDGGKLIGVQHHHAHLVAVLAERGIPGPAIGLILDGTGYGSDGLIWGGEILAGDANGFERLGHFEPFPLPGGEAAVKAPWRTAVGALRLTFGDDPKVWPKIQFLSDHETGPILEMLDREINCPLTTSCGRLFDTVAALTGHWPEIKYEAQAAIEFMALTTPEEVARAEVWSVPFEAAAPSIILPITPFIRAATEDLLSGASPSLVSARFHATLIDLLARAAREASVRSGLTDVVLGGGVFQNEILLAGLMDSLSESELRPLRPISAPAGDGAIALGQAIIARAQL